LHCGGQPRDKRAPTPRRGPDGHPAHGYGIHVRNAGTYTDTRDLLLPLPMPDEGTCPELKPN
ncbi:MAG TPA: hypothetical protein VGN16_13005, partial [Acidobacteriaceae bacterium]